jgi:hypothetical protein
VSSRRGSRRTRASLIRRRPKAPPSFTRDDAEYALKLNALAERGVDGERETAKRKLDNHAKAYGMTAEEMVEKANALHPDQNLTKDEAEKRRLRAEILAPFEAMSKAALLDVVFDLLIKLSRRK